MTSGALGASVEGSDSELRFEISGWILQPARLADIPEVYIQASLVGWRWRRAWRSATGWVPSALRYELENSYEVVGVLRSPLGDVAGILGIADADLGARTAEVEVVSFTQDARQILGDMLPLVVAEIRANFALRVLYLDDWSDEQPIPRQQDGWAVEVVIPRLVSLDGAVLDRRTWALHLSDPPVVVE
jgi:hypothetical protein